VANFDFSLRVFLSFELEKRFSMCIAVLPVFASGHLTIPQMVRVGVIFEYYDNFANHICGLSACKMDFLNSW
jgi:hypothetical protein